MKRICLALLTLCASVSLVGCCFRPCGVDPYSGVTYGGAWEPACGGPLDPFGFWCCFGRGQCGNPCYGNQPVYGQYGGQPIVMGGQTYGNPGCSTCGTQPMVVPQTFAPDGMPMQESESGTPSGALKPMPDSKFKKQEEKSNNTMTYVVPPTVQTMHRPVQYVPAQPRRLIIHQAARQPYVQAH